MINHMYKNFLENKDEYKKSEVYWDKLLDSILKDKSISYRKRLNYFSGDGSQFRDGNPIYDCYNEKENFPCFVQNTVLWQKRNPFLLLICRIELWEKSDAN